MYVLDFRLLKSRLFVQRTISVKMYARMFRSDHALVKDNETRQTKSIRSWGWLLATKIYQVRLAITRSAQVISRKDEKITLAHVWKYWEPSVAIASVEPENVSEHIQEAEECSYSSICRIPSGTALMARYWDHDHVQLMGAQIGCSTPRTHR